MPGTEVVTIACKMPGGVILRVFEWVEVEYPLPGGGTRPVKEAWEIPDARFVVKGVAHEAGKSPDAPMSYGYALTPGCPKELWDKWLEQNAKSDMVKNKLIFAHVQEASVKSIAKENKDGKSGLEPLLINEKLELIDERRPKNPVFGMDVQKADV